MFISGSLIDPQLVLALLHGNLAVTADAVKCLKALKRPTILQVVTVVYKTTTASACRGRRERIAALV
jgi:hypothetical protein